MVTLKNFALATFLLFALNTLNAQSKKALEVLSIESNRFEAMTKADTAALRPMLAEDLVYIHSNALEENKAEHLAAIASRKLIYERMLRQSATVRLYGKTALVNGQVNVQGVLNGNPFGAKLRYTAVYRRNQGAWQLVNWQSTRLP